MTRWRPPVSWPWAAFVAGVVAGVVGLVWLSMTALRLEDEEARTRAKAATSESARLALWRMDLALARLMTLEAARPVAQYAVASPSTDARVLLHFEAAPDGQLASPEVTAGSDRSALDDVQAQLARAAPQVQVALAGNTRDELEFNARAHFAQRNLGNEVQDEAPPGLTPAWYGERLVLQRTVTVAGRRVLQGAVLDWPRIRAELLGDIASLLPRATLEPAASPSGEWVLATLPVRLEPGTVLLPPPPPQVPVRLVIAAGGLGLLVALAAFAALLLGTMSLAERRAAFVSAVTHELRTPLTTFRMYSEMLEQGMVPADKQAEYLATLRREAERLDSLVENVLVWARLEGRRPRKPTPHSVTSLLERVVPRLVDRATQAGMTLVPPVLPEVTVLAEPMSVEQVLFNLVDNAAKYAGKGTITLEVRPEERRVVFAVRDQGPGVASDVTSRLFEPFQKSASEAADSARGVGLGLALSRRLARAMGGELTLAPGPGATFELRLERV